jgi:hypothetical protein
MMPPDHFPGAEWAGTTQARAEHSQILGGRAILYRSWRRSRCWSGSAGGDPTRWSRPVIDGMPLVLPPDLRAVLRGHRRHGLPLGRGRVA